MTKKTFFSIVTIAVLVLAIVLFFVFGGAKLLKTDNEVPADDSVIESSSGIYINEVVSKSRSSLVLSDGSHPDWLELYNGSGRSISLNGMGLTDDPKASVKYTLPSVTLGSGEYMVILLTGEDGELDGYYTAGFRLDSRTGEVVSITEASGAVIQTVEVPALSADISYGRASDGSYKYFAAATPEEENSKLCSDSADFPELSVEPGDILINEYQLLNKVTLRDADGEYGEWVEIKNTGSESVDLSGYGLSDSMYNIGKWHFDGTVIEPGECIAVFLSGKNRTSGELHADFGLNKEEARLILTDNRGRVIDAAELKWDSKTASVGRSMDDITKWLYYPSPTPNADNTSKGFERIDKNEEKYLPN